MYLMMTATDPAATPTSTSMEDSGQGAHVGDSAEYSRGSGAGPNGNRGNGVYEEDNGVSRQGEVRQVHKVR